MITGIIIMCVLSVLIYAYTDNDYLDFWKGKAFKSKSGKKFRNNMLISLLLFVLIILLISYILF